MEVGIIGFGGFGKFITRHLSGKADLFVHDLADKRVEAESLGATFASLREVAGKPIVILAVPMESFHEMLHTLKEFLGRGALILDVCSLKIFSCKAMREILPQHVEIIGTHPLFGPQSAPCSLHGMKIALCNVSACEERFDKVSQFCKELGLQVFVSTPEEHDRQMAVSQALTHFIGQIVSRIGIRRVEMSTKTFDHLIDVVEFIGNDTRALFENMQTMNPFAQEVRERFVQETVALHSMLKRLEDKNEV